LEHFAGAHVETETLTRRSIMPAKSKAQQKAAGAALSAKRGDTEVGELKGASKSMYKSMTEKELEEFASTKHKGKPEHKDAR
jgi:hypothetical protein